MSAASVRRSRSRQEWLAVQRTRCFGKSAFEKDCSQMRHMAMSATAGESPDTGEFEADSEVVAEGRVQELA